MVTLLEMISGWRLLFIEDAPNVVLKSGGRGLVTQSRKMKDAQVTLWERETETGINLHLLVRTAGASGKIQGYYMAEHVS